LLNAFYIISKLIGKEVHMFINFEISLFTYTIKRCLRVFLKLVILYYT
jgi:hypothetical protein